MFGLECLVYFVIDHVDERAVDRQNVFKFGDMYIMRSG